MNVDELLRRVVAVLEDLELPYLLTGSIATTLYGEPRFTNDIDVVVDLPARRIEEFCAAFPSDEYYLDEESVRRAVDRHRQFNVIHPRSALKVDVIIPPPSAFERSRFARARREAPATDFTAVFSSPEDAIIKKMESYRDGGSDKHLRDIVGVLKIGGEAIDREYIGEWAQRLDVQEIWQRILQRIGGR